MSSRQT